MMMKVLTDDLPEQGEAGRGQENLKQDSHREVPPPPPLPLRPLASAGQRPGTRAPPRSQPQSPLKWMKMDRN